MNITHKHLVIWLLYSIFLLLFFNYYMNIETSIIHLLGFLFSQLFTFYLNYKMLIAKYYEKNHFIWFSFINFLLLILGAFSISYFKEFSMEALQIEETSITNIYYLEVLFAYLMPNIVAIFVAFSVYELKKKKNLEAKNLSILEAEKSFLIQQINPHFLFNTLNNIYSLTLENNTKGSDAILQLSKILDYSLYQNKEKNVSLEKEIIYINNYISLFKLKDESIDSISFNYEKSYPKTKIAPMLLLPFIENAFKHGNIMESDGKVTIRIHSDKNTLSFYCSNSYSAVHNVDKTGGIGIQNVRRRLTLLYPNNHSLTIKKTTNEFKVQLTLETNDT